MELKKIKTATLLLVIIAVNSLQAQEKSPKIKEVGIGFSNFNSYSLQYRWGNVKRLFRINAAVNGENKQQKNNNTQITYSDLQGSTVSRETTTTSPFNVNFNLGLSILKLKAINEKFGFLHGAILGTSYQYYKENSSIIENHTYYTGDIDNVKSSSSQNSSAVSPYLGIVLGASYKLNTDFSLYAEIDPNVYFSYNKIITESNTPETAQYSATKSNLSTKYHNFGVSGLTNSGASLSLVYRF